MVTGATKENKEEMGVFLLHHGTIEGATIDKEAPRAFAQNCAARAAAPWAACLQCASSWR